LSILTSTDALCGNVRLDSPPPQYVTFCREFRQSCPCHHNLSCRTNLPKSPHSKHETRGPRVNATGLVAILLLYLKLNIGRDDHTPVINSTRTKVACSSTCHAVPPPFANGTGRAPSPDTRLLDHRIAQTRFHCHLKRLASRLQRHQGSTRSVPFSDTLILG
jgi:hypothetical protein